MAVPTIHDPVLTVVPVPGSPGLRLLRVEFVVACAPFDPAIGHRVTEQVVVRAVDEHDADVTPRAVPVVEVEGSFVMAEGRHHRRAERAVYRTDLDVAQDWWDTDQGGSTVPIAEWVDHIAAEVRLTYAATWWRRAPPPWSPAPGARWAGTEAGAGPVADVPELHVGCPMWAHKPWWGRHLPDGLGRHDQLAAYATWCNAVEGNTTFYGAPSPATVSSWAEQAPAGFRFAFKLPRSITHDRRLRDAADETAMFCRLLGPLGERADPVTVQLPASFGPPQLGDLSRFLAEAPASHRWAVEVRHPDFFTRPAVGRALERVLARHDAEWVGFDTVTLFATPPRDQAEREAWTSKPRVPRRTEALTDRPVVRYIGRDDPEATARGWQPWLEVVAGWLAEGRRPLFFVHTPDNVDAPPLARRFHREVAALVPDLTPLPDPRRPAPATLF